MYRESNDKKWKDSLEALRPRMDRIIAEHAAEIRRWEEDGREVMLLVALKLDWEESGFGLSSLSSVEMTDAQLAAEGVPEPPLKLAERSLPGAILDSKVGRTIEATRLEFVLEGTRPDVRRLREIGEQLTKRGLGEDERSRLREERDRLTEALPEDVLPPGPSRELTVPPPVRAPAQATVPARAAAIAAKRQEVRSLEHPNPVLGSEQRADVDKRLRDARVELRLLELEEHRGTAFDGSKRAEVRRLLEDVVFFEWKAERQPLPDKELMLLNDLRQKLGDITRLR
jgi:hypothetical protein